MGTRCKYCGTAIVDGAGAHHSASCPLVSGEHGYRCLNCGHVYPGEKLSGCDCSGSPNWSEVAIIDVVDNQWTKQDADA